MTTSAGGNQDIDEQHFFAVGHDCSEQKKTLLIKF
jgi:hypothetical protein